MPQQFKDINELTIYLGAMEERIKCLEEENRKFRETQLSLDDFNPDEVADYLEDFLPETNLLHPNFLKRAFAVWGHFFVANLIIGAIAFMIYAFLIISILGVSLRSFGR
jgi:hypothetical protein